MGLPINKFMKITALASPTYILASFLKKRFNRTKTIRVLNYIYLSFAVVSSFSLLIYQEYYPPANTLALNEALPFFIIFIWSYYLLSRCNEIFWSFLADAFDKMDEKNKSKSELTPKDRISLSLKSYIELILNFAILYLLLPKTSGIWANSNAPESIAEAVYFSGVTITTLGYGDISPTHWYPQFLTVYEVFCGFILLIVCFAIYAGRVKKT